MFALVCDYQNNSEKGLKEEEEHGVGMAMFHKLHCGVKTLVACSSGTKALKMVI